MASSAVVTSRQASHEEARGDEGEHQADGLGKPLRRAGDEHGLTEAGGDHRGGELPEGVEARAAGHSQGEPDGEHGTQPEPAGEQRHRGDEHHESRHGPGSLLVDDGREFKRSAHVSHNQ
jgi:hypothetical protein